MSLKSLFVLTIILDLMTPCFVGAQNNGKPTPKKAVVSDFTRLWNGSEKCESVSAPVAIVSVSPKAGNEVYLTGIYSVHGKITGKISRDSVEIPLQQVEDPNFTNLGIGGTLTLSPDKKTLSGRIVIINNESRDVCTVTYRR